MSVQKVVQGVMVMIVAEPGVVPDEAVRPTGSWSSDGEQQEEDLHRASIDRIRHEIEAAGGARQPTRIRMEFRGL